MIAVHVAALGLMPLVSVPTFFGMALVHGFAGRLVAFGLGLRLRLGALLLGGALLAFLLRLGLLVHATQAFALLLAVFLLVGHRSVLSGFVGQATLFSTAMMPFFHRLSTDRIALEFWILGMRGGGQAICRDFLIFWNTKFAVKFSLFTAGMKIRFFDPLRHDLLLPIHVSHATLFHHPIAGLVGGRNRNPFWHTGFDHRSRLSCSFLSGCPRELLVVLFREAFPGPRHRILSSPPHAEPKTDSHAICDRTETNPPRRPLPRSNRSRTAESHSPSAP